MFHVASSEDYDYHTYCPITTISWCQHNRDTLNHTNLYQPCILLNVVAAIKPIYFDLTKEDVLTKCLRGLVMKVSMQLYGNGALTLPGLFIIIIILYFILEMGYS